MVAASDWKLIPEKFLDGFGDGVLADHAANDLHFFALAVYENTRGKASLEAQFLRDVHGTHQHREIYRSGSAVHGELPVLHERLDGLVALFVYGDCDHRKSLVAEFLLI